MHSKGRNVRCRDLSVVFLTISLPFISPPLWLIENCGSAFGPELLTGVHGAIVHAAVYLLVLYTDLESLLKHCHTKLCPILFSVARMSQWILQPKPLMNTGLFKCH